MAKYVKNDTGSAKTWVGQEIAAGTYHLIPTNDEMAWANDAVLYTAILDAEAIVSNTNSSGGHITDAVQAINFLKDIVPMDVDGSPLYRMKITKTGWHYQVHSMEFTTSKLNSVYDKNSAETSFGFHTLKFYKADGSEITSGVQADLDAYCVKTIIDWEPAFDVELIGGTLYQSAIPTTNIRMWVTALPDIPVAYGGSVPFVTGGLNLKLMELGRVLDIDGKTPKLLPYSATNHTNKMRIILTHDAGVQHDLLMMYKLFRANT
jgi:hypothetical protein